ncbi:Uncharacterised protein [Mycobacteroides abscessus subsp. abscessus]|nr:Uncharacterised protein [Mycobacteroides abscessus subsp. abscessus]SKT68508.1 Uncharacterised protein [Mycobacteroides abscessus subsp. abscessus]SKW80425.1 Uncharacterised protein [Mycobacteroides abscessus subsp. abscessus]
MAIPEGDQLPGNSKGEPAGTEPNISSCNCSGNSPASQL